MRFHSRRVVGLGLGVWAFALLTAVFLFAAEKAAPPVPDWDLTEFVEHLHRHSLAVRVVPSRADGQWVDQIYLTENPNETWQSFQRKPRVEEAMDLWQGSVWVWRVRPQTETQFYLVQFGRCGCRIGNMVLVGDERLIQRIDQTVPEHE